MGSGTKPDVVPFVISAILLCYMQLAKREPTRSPFFFSLMSCGFGSPRDKCMQMLCLSSDNGRAIRTISLTS